MSEDNQKIEGRLHGDQNEPEQPDSLLERLIYMLIIAVMISLAQTILGVVTVRRFNHWTGSPKPPSLFLHTT